MGKLSALYLGAAGQHAVASEFLIRGYNVAIPEVDRGDDLFVVKDQDGEFTRIQVKSANAKEKSSKGIFMYQFKVRLDQLSTPQTPELFYVFAMRHQDRWACFLCISRSDLYAKHLDPSIQIGSAWEDHLIFKIQGSAKGVFCQGYDLNHYVGIDESRWPPMQL